MNSPRQSTYPGFYWDHKDECFRRLDTDARIEGNAPTRAQWDEAQAERQDQADAFLDVNVFESNGDSGGDH